MNELDKLLAELKDEYRSPKPEQNSASVTPAPQSKMREISSPLDSLLAEVKTEMEGKIPPPAKPDLASNLARQKPTPPQNKLLQDLQAEFKEQQRAEEQRLEQQRLEQQRLEEERKKRQRQTLSRNAEEWLKKLDPKSDEGFWFEEFSYSYPSKLEAAIDYLEALRESRFHA
jgi:type I site-specific restriction-modification system R (restriction) subunit